MWQNERFAQHDSPLIQNPAQKAIAANYDWLAANASADLAMAYLYRTVNKGDSKVDQTGMAKLIGCVGTAFNAYGVGGSADVPTFTVDPDGVTLRLGRPRANWDKHLATDPRPRYTLPVVDPTRKA